MILFEALTWMAFGLFLAAFAIYLQGTLDKPARGALLAGGGTGGLLGGYVSHLAMPRLWDIGGYSVGALVTAGLLALVGIGAAWLATSREQRA